MALFSFRDLQPVAYAPKLRAALEVDEHEPLLARRLRGTRRWDAGRRVVEIVVPYRLPEPVRLHAEGLLSQNLDLAAPDFKYGDYLDGDLAAHFQADQVLVLHDWAQAVTPEYAVDPDNPHDLLLVSETEDESFHRFALVCFFEPPAWRRLHWLPWRLWLRWRSRQVLGPLRRWREDDYR